MAIEETNQTITALSILDKSLPLIGVAPGAAIGLLIPVVA